MHSKHKCTAPLPTLLTTGFYIQSRGSHFTGISALCMPPLYRMVDAIYDFLTTGPGPCAGLCLVLAKMNVRQRRMAPSTILWMFPGWFLGNERVGRGGGVELPVHVAQQRLVFWSSKSQQKLGLRLPEFLLWLGSFNSRPFSWPS